MKPTSPCGPDWGKLGTFHVPQNRPTVVPQFTLPSSPPGPTVQRASDVPVWTVHVLAGLTAVVTGATAALVRKGSPRHIRAGRWYYQAITVVFATATVLAMLRWRQGPSYPATCSLSDSRPGRAWLDGGVVGICSRTAD